MTIAANSAGVVTGHITIPPNVLTGSKHVTFQGAGGSRGEAIFVGSNKLVSNVYQQIQQLTLYIDPLAQTFTPADTVQITDVDLHFTVKGTSPVRVQIRGTEVGIPNQTIYGEGRVEAANILVNGSVTRVSLNAPCLVRAATEYCLVVLSDDPATAVGLAELGKYDSVAQTWVTQQAYQVGVLLTSSNNSTWTASQTQDLWFRLITASYAPGAIKEIPLGTVSAAAVTDIVMLGGVDAPASGATVEFDLTFPDLSKLTVSNNQVLNLAAPVTGNISVLARIRSAAGVSGVLHPGTSLALGVLGTSGTYYTRAIPSVGASKLTVVYDALIPAGAAVLAEWAAVGSNVWATITPLSNTVIDDGFREFTCQLATGVTAAAIAVRITLNGSAAARPRVRNLQVLRT